ncbi:MAG: universal stress protein [Actinomycetota bacterium]
MYRTILVGTDGSDSAAEAVAHAAELARTVGAELLVAHVNPGREPDAPVLSKSAAYPGSEIGKAILRDVARVHGADVPLRTTYGEGNPADAILEIAEREDVDLIVVGNRGMPKGQRMVLGNVPNHVSHHARCSVLIVRTT